jgi:hypothetical protein
MNVVKTSLGINARGFEVFEVKNAETGEVVGQDLVAPDSIDE